jgi:hypothetical protein
MDSRVDNGRGHTKRRTLDENYAERSPDPTRALSPRQLPTDHVHAVPTRVYQCDQSSRQLPGRYRPCCSSKKGSRLTSGNVFPQSRPSKLDRNARTVLAGKGPLRRVNTGAPLPAPRRSGQAMLRWAAPVGTLRDLLRWLQNRTPKTLPSNLKGVDRSLHISVTAI